MNRVCVVDFDRTLLTVDSTKYLVIRERLYLRPPILFWGILFLLVRSFLPRTRQYSVRRRAKYLVLRALNELGAARIAEGYAKIFSNLLNFKLLKSIREQYQRVYVISSAWQPLIEGTLASAGVSGFRVFGTEFIKDFENFSTCWHQKKAKVARELGLSEFDLYTDSYDDEPLMKLASKVIMV